MPPQDQPLGFAADILPLFRAQDIDCMRPMGVHLDDPVWMTNPAGDLRRPDHANARRVFATLRSGRMPPHAPWSDAQLATYEAWMAAGFAP
jgi:hypothetical protein